MPFFFGHLLVLFACGVWSLDEGVAGPSNEAIIDHEILLDVKQYSLSTREYMDKTLRAISLFDTYNEKVTDKAESFIGGSELTAAIFTALAGLRRSETSFSQAVSSSYSIRRSMEQSLRGISDKVGDIEKDGTCTMDDQSYTQDLCEGCKQSIPGFQVKTTARTEVKKMINTIRVTIPKHFLYYISDIYVILAEGIRIIDKVNTCVQNATEVEKCDLREKSFKFFSSRMLDVGKKEDSLVKLISAEKSKVAIAVTQMTEMVKHSMESMSSCLSVKNGTSLQAEVSRSADLSKEEIRLKLTLAAESLEKIAAIIREIVASWDK